MQAEDVDLLGVHKGALRVSRSQAEGWGLRLCRAIECGIVEGSRSRNKKRVG